MKRTLMYYITIILTILLILVSTYSYAAEITKETLTKKFKEIFTNAFNGRELVKVEDDVIIMDYDNWIDDKEESSILKGKIEIKYSLTEKPTFILESVFKEGMTLQECKDEANKDFHLTNCFQAIANIKGVKTSDASWYFSNHYSYKLLQTESYAKMMEELSKEENFKSTKDYVEKRYNEDIMVEDKIFSMSVKKGSSSNGEYKVIYELIINSEEDFNIITEEVEKNREEAYERYNIITNTTISTPLPTKTPSTANIGTMPNAGFELNVLNILKVVLGLSLAGIIVYSIYNKRYNSK